MWCIDLPEDCQDIDAIKKEAQEWFDYRVAKVNCMRRRCAQSVMEEVMEQFTAYFDWEPSHECYQAVAEMLQADVEGWPAR